MAEINKIEIKDGNILVNLKINKSEYELLGNKVSDILLAPKTDDFFNLLLTTGRLGNSNRVMIPKKILEKFEIKEMEKKVRAKAFKIDDEVFLVIKLKRAAFGIPVFKEVSEDVHDRHKKTR
jgi:hypothetical protein